MSSHPRPGWQAAALNDGWTYRDRVPRGDGGILVSDWLADRYRHSDGAVWRRRIAAGELDCNGALLSSDRQLEGGEALCWRRPPWLEEAIPDQWETIHDDGDLLVINKPPGMAVHAGSGLAWGLIDVVRQNLSGTYVELVHRLDRETSGCLVLALSGSALSDLSRQFREGSVIKQYLCLLDGVLGEPLVEIDAPLTKARGRDHHEVRVDGQGKAAKTRFRLLQAFADCSYIEAELFTGRTHQIRAHMKLFTELQQGKECALDGLGGASGLFGDKRYVAMSDY